MTNGKQRVHSHRRREGKNFFQKLFRNKYWGRTVLALCGAAVFFTTYALILPAITMSGVHPALQAESRSAWSGDELEVKVTAEAPEGRGEKTFVLIAESLGAGLSDEYRFDENSQTEILDDAGNTVVLHRSVRKNAKATLDYWFTLPAGESTSFTLSLMDQVDVRELIRVSPESEDEILRGEESYTESQAAADAEKAAAASEPAAPAGAVKLASGSNAVKTVSVTTTVTASASNASGATASNAVKTVPVKIDEEKQVIVTGKDGNDYLVDLPVDSDTGELQDGELFNDLGAEEEDSDMAASVTVATLKLSVGFGDSLSEAVRDTMKSADKRGNAVLTFRWKEPTEYAEALTWSGNGANIEVIFDEEAGIPADAVLSVRELVPGSDEYNLYLESARAAAGPAADQSVSDARFFDIVILSNGEALEPKTPAQVLIRYDDQLNMNENDEVNVVHFADEGTEILKPDAEHAGGAENAVDTIRFTQGSFSVTGTFVLRQSLAGSIETSEGTYRVTLTYDETAGIPKDASLKVREITENDPEYETYYQQSQAAMKEGSTLSFAHFLDITILASDGVTEIEPKTPVQVSIALDESQKMDASTEVSAVHFDSSGSPEVLKDVKTRGSDTELKSVSFQADAFSVYAILGTVLEKTVLASDGKNYKITAAYGPDAGIPENAVLSVTEIEETSELYGSYVEKTEAVLGMEKGSAQYVRMFDIKIVDKDDPAIKYQPAEGKTVDVKISLEDAYSSNTLGVVHFSDTAEDDKKENGDETSGEAMGEAVSENGTVSFAADGFSIYVIAETDLYSRLVFRFHDSTGAVISTQYIKKYLDPSDNTEKYETLYDPGLVPEYGQRFVGWAYTADETDSALMYQLADLNSQAAVFLDSSAQEDKLTKDVYAIMEEAWYLRYIDVDRNGTVKILNFVSKSKNAEDKNVNIDYMPELPEGVHYKGWYDPIEPRVYSPDLDESPAEFDVFTLDRHLDLYLKLDNRVWLVFDANAGGPGSGATYTPPQLIYTDATPAQVTEKPEDPEWKGYTFTGWNTNPDGTGTDWLKVESREYDDAGNLISTTYSANLFGSPIEEDVTLYAQWEPNDNFYRIAYWRQKETDAVDTPDSEKKYDFYGYREVRTGVKTGDSVSSLDSDRDMDAVATQLRKKLGDENKFVFNETKSDTGSKVVAGDGSTVLNMYFDRVVMEFIFNQNFNWYTVAAESDPDPLYGYVEGEYVELSRGETETTYTYSLQYTYNVNGDEGDPRYALINNEYVLLTRDRYASVDGGETEFTGQRYRTTTSNSTTPHQYGLVNGELVELKQGTTGGGGCGGGTQTYWYYGNNTPYNGTRYVEDEEGNLALVGGSMVNVGTYTRYLYNGEAYQDTRYSRSSNGEEYKGTRYNGVNGSAVDPDDHTGTQYGTDSRGGFIPLDRESHSSCSFTYPDENGDPKQYDGTLYNRGQTNTLRGLYGSQMKEHEWPEGRTWQYANQNASTYDDDGTRRRTTLNAPWTSYTISDNAYEYSHGEAPYTTWHLYSTSYSGTVNVVYWRQDTEGNYTRRTPTSGIDDGGLYIGNDKFYAFSVYGYEYGGTGGVPASSGNNGEFGWHDLTSEHEASLTMHAGHGDINIYYQRDKYSVTFMSNDANSTVKPYPDKIFYEKNLAELKDWYIPKDTDGKEGYFFDGWYLDANFTKPFEPEKETMPHNDLILYGKWSTYRVRVVLVPTPNNGNNDEVHFPNNQLLTFRTDYNEKVSDTNINANVAERTGYKLIGWYTSPNFEDGTEWNFSTQINSSVQAVDMTYQQSEDWENNVYGDNDGEHKDVEGILKLYAKWQLNFGVDDLFIEYEVPESFVKRDAFNNLLTVIPQDTYKYTYNPNQTAIVTQIKEAPENYIDAFSFAGWELLDMAGLETGYVLQPKTTIEYADVNPVVQLREIQDDQGNTSTMKVIVFRAVFTKNDNNQGTVVTFDGNGGKTVDNDSETRSLTMLVNQDFYIPGSSGTNAFQRTGYNLVGWSFSQSTTPDEFRSAVEEADGDLQTLARAGMFSAGTKVAADNLKLSDFNNWVPLSNTVYGIWEPNKFTITVTKIVDGEEVSDKSFAFTATGLPEDGDNSFSLVNGQTKTVEEVPYGTKFSLTEMPFTGYSIQSVVAKQISEPDGTPLTEENWIDLAGTDGKEYEVQGDIRIVYTNKLTKVPVVLEKVGYNNSGSSTDEYALPGAKFTIYTSETGTEIAKAPDGTELKDLESDRNGIFYQGMLETGTYYLYEATVPDGYYPPGGRFKLSVEQNSVSVTATWVTGSTGAEVGTVTAVSDAQTGIKTFNVFIRNTTGYELPSTGGTGTSMFYVLGFLMAGSAILLLLNRKKRNG